MSQNLVLKKIGIKPIHLPFNGLLFYNITIWWVFYEVLSQISGSTHRLFFSFGWRLEREYNPLMNLTVDSDSHSLITYDGLFHLCSNILPLMLTIKNWALDYSLIGSVLFVLYQKWKIIIQIFPFFCFKCSESYVPTDYTLLCGALILHFAWKRGTHCASNIFLIFLYFTY